jgi:hypothetical protein
LSPMMDRFTTSEGLTQINFIEFVVAPLYCHVVVLLPEVPLLTLHCSTYVVYYCVLIVVPLYRHIAALLRYEPLSEI